MKRMFILSISSLLFLVYSSHAQVQKGDFLLGGSLGFNTNETTNSPTRSNANITPRIGYAIGNNSVLYLNLGYSYSRSKTDGADYKSTTNSFSSGVSWKRFISIKERFGLYTNLYGSFTRAHTKQNVGANETKITTYAAGITPGVYYIAMPWLILNVDAGGLAYNYSKSSYGVVGSSSHTSSFDVNFLSSFTFGVDFILNKKKK